MFFPCESRCQLAQRIAHCTCWDVVFLGTCDGVTWRRHVLLEQWICVGGGASASHCVPKHARHCCKGLFAIASVSHTLWQCLVRQCFWYGYAERWAGLGRLAPCPSPVERMSSDASLCIAMLRVCVRCSVVCCGGCTLCASSRMHPTIEHSSFAEWVHVCCCVIHTVRLHLVLELCMPRASWFPS